MRVCTQCGSTESYRWFDGPDGPKTLCMSCGMTRAHAAAKQRRLQAEQDGVIVSATGAPSKNSKTPIKNESKVWIKEKIDTPSNFGSSSTTESLPQMLARTKQSRRLVLKDTPESNMQLNNKRAASEALCRSDPKIRRLVSEPISSSIPRVVSRTKKSGVEEENGGDNDDDGEQIQLPTSMLQQIADQTKQAKRLISKIDTGSKKLTRWMEERTKATKDYYEMRTAIMQAGLQDTKDENSRLKHELVDAKEATAADLKKDLAEAERDLAELRQMKGENERLRSNNCNLQSDLSEIMCENAKLRGENDNLQTKIRSQEHEIAELKGKVERVQQMLR